jgi:hypothetical protein
MPNGLITVDALREIFAIDAGLADGRFERALSAASTRIRAWVGDDAYEDAGSLPPEEPQRADDLALAEAHLAMGYAILGVNTSMRLTGIVSSERVEGNVTISYLKPTDLELMQQQYLDLAETIARPYLDPTKSDSDVGPGMIVTDCRGALPRPCFGNDTFSNRR